MLNFFIFVNSGHRESLGAAQTQLLTTNGIMVDTLLCLFIKSSYYWE